MKFIAGACVAWVGLAGFAAVARAGGDVDGDDTLVRARISGGPDAPAPGLGATISGGWGGAHAQAIGDVSAEALLLDRITLRAGVDYDAGRTRPTAGVSYVFFDPHASAVGVLAGVSYKPEGLTEPEGEFEGTIAVSRAIGAGLLSGSVSYGQDADFKQHDGEVALGGMAPIAKRIALGGIARMRDGLGSTTDLGARWDGLGGAVARMQIDQYQLTAVAGSEVIGAVGGGQKYGLLGTIALSAWW